MSLNLRVAIWAIAASAAVLTKVALGTGWLLWLACWAASAFLVIYLGKRTTIGVSVLVAVLGAFFAWGPPGHDLYVQLGVAMSYVSYAFGIALAITAFPGSEMTKKVFPGY